MSFFEKIRQGLAKTKKQIAAQLGGLFAAFTGANEEFFEELEETLILADMGAELAMDAVDALRQRAKKENLRTAQDMKTALGEILLEKISFDDISLHMNTRPSVAVVIGVNGVGKTTTIGKLAKKQTEAGKSVILAAGDTFRAAAAEQLAVWAERSGADLVRHAEGSDPAAVVFDACAAAKARGKDLVIVDTAGRLHNKDNLMKELAKISRVVDRELPDCDRETLLVLDATTGQNGLNQARQFKEYAGITGIVLTKLDGTAKGGIVFAIAAELGVPVKYIGVGEQVDDLLEFDPRGFVEAILE